jgi:hypothetical protein
MPSGSFVTIGHTSGSSGWIAAVGTGASADCDLQLSTATALNVPPRKTRRFIMSEVPREARFAHSDPTRQHWL